MATALQISDFAEQPDSTRYAVIAEELAAHGWSVQTDFLPPSLTALLKADLHSQTTLTPAGVGRGEQHRLAQQIRRDKTCWLDGGSAVQRHFLHIAEQLRLHLNRHLFLGLFDFEAHYALYESGAFYRKHLDAFQGQGSRRLSTVYYLNENWQPTDGGELVFYHPHSDRVLQRIAPIGGSLVIFVSEEFYHEVLPARAPRYSIAGWYRINTSIQGAIDPAD